MKKTLILLITSFIITLAQADERPNIILIMGDDIGFSDLGAWGSEIDTPNLDRMANEGMRFTQFYNMAKCNPTRSCMMTGTFWGNAQAQSLGALMTRAGYATMTSGKEHYDGWVPDRCKAMHSYEKSFTHYGGAGPFFDHNPVSFHLNEKKLAFEEVENLSEPYYKTNVITDYAVRFLEETRDDSRPFFLYLAYESAHYPLHALDEDYAKYRGNYMKGWDVVRKARYEKQKAIGLFGDTAPTLSTPTGLGGMPYQAWKELSDTKKDDLDLQMAAFAAMVHALDRNIGRVIKQVEAMGRLDNTLIMYLSDNGSCAFKRWKNVEEHPDPRDHESYRSLHSVWANVGDTPFRLFKQNGHEGGSRTHFTAFWPKVIKPGSFHREPGHIVDIMPTFLELAKNSYPTEQDGKPTPKLDGLSLVPAFKGKQRPQHDLIIAGWGEKKRSVRQGDWKIVKNGGDWELYNMAKDPSELNDLATTMPEKVNSLEAVYDKWKSDRGLTDVPQAGGKTKNKDSDSKNKKSERKKRNAEQKKKEAENKTR